MTAAAAARDGHRLFRTALLALAYPGRPMPAPAGSDRDLARMMLEATWPDTAPIWSTDSTLLPPGRPSAGAADADVLLVLGPTSHGRLVEARRGTEELPENGATAIYIVDPAVAPQTRVRLSGPGVADTTSVTLPLTAGELADRAVCCEHLPLGVDLLAVTGGTIVGLPRTTQVEVVG
jgi:alpha-D-ribose 1-methylphosphonate 5-triphosphate synthase subunit PhnH